MKFKFAILLSLIIAFTASCQSNKQPENVVQVTFNDPQIQADKLEQLSKNKNSKNNKKGKKSDLDNELVIIQDTDLTKVFAQAEKYFKAGQAWQKLRCEPKSGFLCSKRECAKRDVFTFLILDKKEQNLTRCEKDFCETFKATIKQTGVYTNVYTEGPVGTLVRVLGDSRYKEITTVGLDAYIANGNCEVVK